MFTQLSKLMLQKSGLSKAALILYSILRDRADLSVANGWKAENGTTYIVASRKAIAEKLGWSKGKCLKTFNELMAANLIVEDKQLRGASRWTVRAWHAPSILTDEYLDVTEDNNHSDRDAYIQLDKDLMGKVSDTALLLYGLVKDAIDMSIQFHKHDERGYYNIIDSKKTMRVLDCANGALAKAWTELEDGGYVTRQRDGFACHWRVYLSSCNVVPIDADFEPDRCGNETSIDAENEPALMRKMDTNQLSYNPTTFKSTFFNQPQDAEAPAPAAESEAIKNRLEKTILADSESTVMCFSAGEDFVLKKDLMAEYASLTEKDFFAIATSLLPYWTTTANKTSACRNAMHEYCRKRVCISA